ncbi:MAG: pyridoxamine 5'-phosphate oxidase family protein [Lachnospiraceae bacterium]|nr:pyridoxamine 5'-phosphate oxidase family protein [Lachnospiraceae bacterium]
MRRVKQQMTEEECRGLLKMVMRGTLAFSESEGYPYALPINFYYDEEKNVLMFHGALSGKKSELLKEGAPVCFTGWDDGYKKEGDWAYTVNSIMVFGRIHVATEEEEKIDILRKLGCKYYPTMEEVDEALEKNKARACGFWMTIDHLTGKTVHEK